MLPKRKARELALQILFQTEFSPDIKIQDFLALVENSDTARSPEVVQEGNSLAKGVLQNLNDIDSLIQSAAQHWKVDRMALVDRNLMRIAVYEMKYASDKLVPNIAINEAIELAKEYSTPESARFVNGILDQVAKCL